MVTQATEDQTSGTQRRVVRELLTALVLLVLGVLVLPLAVFQLGGLLFGAYEGGTGSLGSFFEALFEALGQRDTAAWLLVLSPLGMVLLLRLGVWFLRTRRTAARADTVET